MDSNHDNLDTAATRLKEGGIGVFPTETVYGLGANALDAVAVARVFEAKGRPLTHPLIVHIANPTDIALYADPVPVNATRLIQAHWPGPLTVVLPKRDLIPDIVTAGLPSVGIRCPSHPVARKLLEVTGLPIAAPSANFFGQISPTELAHAKASLPSNIDFFLDGGPCTVGLESTIVSFLGKTPLLLRPGGLSLEHLREILPDLKLAPPSAKPIAPGMLEKHYAPNTPLVLLENLKNIEWESAIGLLSFMALPQSGRFSAVEVLSEKGDLREAAANFYSALRRLDALGLKRIVAITFPTRDLGIAINDRLLRASR